MVNINNISTPLKKNQDDDENLGI